MVSSTNEHKQMCVNRHNHNFSQTYALRRPLTQSDVKKLAHWDTFETYFLNDEVSTTNTKFPTTTTKFPTASPSVRAERVRSHHTHARRSEALFGFATTVGRCRAVPCRVPCRAVPCRAMPCRAVPCRAVPCRAVPCCAVPCRAVPCRAVPCCAVP